MNSSDSAEEIVKLSLDGMEVALRIAGSGAKNIAVMIYTIMKDNQQTKGKTRLTNMLKTKEPLKIFTIRAEDLKKFSQEAKKYGVLYCALADKKNQKIDGMVDIMVRESDASKINRISERFKFARVDTGSIEREIEKNKEKRNGQEPQDKGVQEKSEDEKFIDDILTKPIQKEEQQQDVSPSNIPEERTEKSQSESSLNTKLSDKKETSNGEKKSVREELKIAEKESKEKEMQRANERENIVLEKKQPKHLKNENEVKRGKRYKEPKHLDTSRKTKKKKSKGRSK